MKRLLFFALIAALFLPAFGQDETRIQLANLMRPRVPIYGYNLNQNLRTTDSPTFAGLTLSGGTASTLAYLNASKAFTSLANGAGYLLNNGSGGLSWGAIDTTSLVARDGTRELTADWNVGAFKITSPSIVRSATLTIASATSKTLNADYYCDGTADEVQINAAIQALDGLGGRIILMEGTFYINAPIAYTLTGTDDNNITLEGQGDATVLKLPDGHATEIAMISVAGGTTITAMSGWTDVAGWVYGSSKWTHSTGDTTPLVDTTSPAFVVGTKYRIEISTNYAWPGLTLAIAVGGYTATATATANFAPQATTLIYDFVATGTGALTITPATTFGGDITSIRIMPVLENLEFKNFKIDGNADNVAGANYYAIALNNVVKAKIENVTVTNGRGGGYGLLAISTRNISISNCHLGTWGGNGVELRETDVAKIIKCSFDLSRLEIYSNCNRVILANNTINESCFAIGTDCGLDIDGLEIIGNIFYNRLSSISSQFVIDCAKNITVTGNVIDSKYPPFDLGPDIDQIMISNNTITSPYTNLMCINGTNGLVTGNKFIIGASSACGITCNNSADVTAAGWTIAGNEFTSVAGVLYAGGISLPIGTNILITRNTFRNLQFGISLWSSVTRVKVFDNEYYSVTTPYTNACALSENILQGNSNRRLYKITKTYVEFAALGAASLTADLPIAVFPAKTKIVAMYCDTTTKFVGGGTTAATLVIGKSAGGAEYIAVHDVFTTAIVKGLADADMGTELTRAAAIQGGALVGWTTAITVYARLTTTTAHTDDLTQGSTTFYIETESY